MQLLCSTPAPWTIVSTSLHPCNHLWPMQLLCSTPAPWTIVLTSLHPCNHLWPVDMVVYSLVLARLLYYHLCTGPCLDCLVIINQITTNQSLFLHAGSGLVGHIHKPVYVGFNKVFLNISHNWSTLVHITTNFLVPIYKVRGSAVSLACSFSQSTGRTNNIHVSRVISILLYVLP